MFPQPDTLLRAFVRQVSSFLAQIQPSLQPEKCTEVILNYTAGTQPVQAKKQQEAESSQVTFNGCGKKYALIHYKTLGQNFQLPLLLQKLEEAS